MTCFQQVLLFASSYYENRKNATVDSTRRYETQTIQIKKKLLVIIHISII